MPNPINYNNQVITLNQNGTVVTVQDQNGNTVDHEIPPNLFNPGEFAVDLRTYTNPGGSNLGCVAILKTLIGNVQPHIRFHVGSGNFALSQAQFN